MGSDKHVDNRWNVILWRAAGERLVAASLPGEATNIELGIVCVTPEAFGTTSITLRATSVIVGSTSVTRGAASVIVGTTSITLGATSFKFGLRASRATIVK